MTPFLKLREERPATIQEHRALRDEIAGLRESLENRIHCCTNLQMTNDKLREELELWQTSDGKKLTPREKRLRAALEFYADPETYHAIGFFPDPPCGEFMDDFSDDHGHDDYVMLNEETNRYDLPRPMPGKRARAALGEEEKKA